MIIRSTYKPTATPIITLIPHLPLESIIYISGPMTNLINDNHDAFNNLAFTLRSMGYTVINPAESDTPRDPNTPFHYWYFSVLLGDVLDLIIHGVTHIITLDNFELSLGARCELNTAHNMGIPTIHHTTVTHHHPNNPSMPIAA